MKPALRQSGWVYLWVSVLVIILDQWTKYLVVNHIPYNTAGIEVTSFFNLVHVYNKGAAFSFLASMGGWQRWLFMAVALIITAVLLWFLRKTAKKSTLTCLAVTLVIGGAMGNLIDRVMLGYVVDFLLFYISTENFFWSYPAFNVADIAVCTGAGLLILGSFISKKEAD